MSSMLKKAGLEEKKLYGLNPAAATIYRLLSRISSKSGDPDRELQYQYKAVSSFCTASNIYSRFAILNLIMAVKVK
jgi:hypothetical protein